MSAPAIFDGEVALLSAEAQAGVVTLALERPEAFAAARAGQFALLNSGRAGAPLLSRPMSLLSVTPRLTVTFTVFGGGTQLLADAAPGEALHLVGPLGEPFGEMPDDVLLIADGTHFGTLLGFARERADGGRPVDTIFVTRPPERPAGAVTAGEQDAVLANRFAVLSRSMRAVPLGELEAALEEAPPHAVAAGASNAAMAIVQRVAERRGVAGRAALQTAMPCGLGACQGCIFPRRGGGWLRVCDGPVFSLAEPEFAP